MRSLQRQCSHSFDDSDLLDRDDENENEEDYKTTSTPIDSSPPSTLLRHRQLERRESQDDIAVGTTTSKLSVSTTTPVLPDIISPRSTSVTPSPKMLFNDDSMISTRTTPDNAEAKNSFVRIYTGLKCSCKR